MNRLVSFRLLTRHLRAPSPFVFLSASLLPGHHWLESPFGTDRAGAASTLRTRAPRGDRSGGFRIRTGLGRPPGAPRCRPFGTVEVGGGSWRTDGEPFGAVY